MKLKHVSIQPVQAISLVLCLFVLLLSLAKPCQAVEDSRSLDLIERTEKREPCLDYNVNRNPYFGDLHVHTAFSQDASSQGTRNTPFDAYRFAKGEKLGIQPYDEQGKPLRELQLQRPLDFAAITDHAELLGEVRICNTPGMNGYYSWICLMYRWWPRAAFFYMNEQSSQAGNERFGFCGKDQQVCLQAAKGPWQDIQRAAESNYDRRASCDFTSFIGYEWTGSQDFGVIHRNVLFRNEQVPELPISLYEAGRAEQLWRQLDAGCADKKNGCEALIIPHNSNLSDGAMFQTTMAVDKKIQPISKALAKRRNRLERLVEVMQHKGSSECYFDFAKGQNYGLIAADEFCAFEQLPYNTFETKFMLYLDEKAEPGDGFIREVLRDGLRQEQQLGVNPFKFGFVGSTDTHLGIAGAVAEQGSLVQSDREGSNFTGHGFTGYGFTGHGGARIPATGEVPAALPDDLEFNPGALAVLWAEENSRDALFAAMQRRETYGTSGPRMQLRFFGGWQYPQDLCNRENFVEQAYAQGVPMGADLPAKALDVEHNTAPIFAVWALRDAGTSTKPGGLLQQIQIIKAWVDGQGRSREKIFSVAGDANNGARVDVASCQPHGKGFGELCRVWRDPEFDALQSAYYYARVLENPSCRWSQHVCNAYNVNCDDPATVTKSLKKCCSPLHRPIIQERAWSSPIWYTP